MGFSAKHHNRVCRKANVPRDVYTEADYITSNGPNILLTLPEIMS
jgi:hypothetical protein